MPYWQLASHASSLTVQRVLTAGASKGKWSEACCLSAWHVLPKLAEMHELQASA